MAIIAELLARLGVDKRDFDRKLGGATKTLKKTESDVERISRRLNNIASTAVTALGIRSIIRQSDAYTVMQNRLRVVTDSQVEFTAAQKALFDVSQETRSSISANAELFSRLAVSTQQLGVSQSELIDFTRTLNQAIKVSGATSIEAEQGIRQLAQGIASGAVRGDELRSVLEQLPYVADIIAKQMGVTRGELRELGSQGKITGEIILDAFRNAREEVQEKFNETLPTTAEGVVLVQNSLTNLSGAFSQAVGLGENLGEALETIATRITEIADTIREEKSVINFLGRLLNPGGQQAVDILGKIRQEAAQKAFKNRQRQQGQGGGGQSDFVGPTVDRAFTEGTGNSVLDFVASQSLDSFFKRTEEAFDSLRDNATVTFGAIGEAGGNVFTDVAAATEDLLTRSIPENLTVAQQAWFDMFRGAANATVTMTQIAGSALKSFFDGFGAAVVQAVTQTQDFGTAFLNIFVNVLGSLLQTLISFVLEVIALKIAEIIFGVAASESKFGIGGLIAAVIAIPVLIGALIALSKSQKKRAAQAVSLDTGGFISSDGLAMLHSGERVLTAQEVKDVSPMGGGGIDMILQLDGRTIARQILPYIPREITLRGV